MTQLFTEHIAPHIGAFIGAILTGIAGFAFGKKRMQAEVAGLDADNEGKEIENADKLVKLYKETLDDLGTRYETKFNELSEWSDKKVKLLQEEVDIQKRINDQLKAENTLLKSENSNLKQKLIENKISI